MKIRMRLSAVAALMISLSSIAHAQSEPAPPSTPPATSAEPTNAELMDEVRRLRARLEALEQAARENPPLPSAADIERTKAAINEDVARKAALNQVTVTYDKGLIFKTGDDSFSLRPSVYSQYRYTASLTPDGQNNGNQSGFEVRRLEPGISGNVLNKDFTYDFTLSVNREGGSVNLLDAFFKYRFAPKWSVKFGQYTAQLFQEHNIGTSRQLAAERSLLDATIGAGPVDRVQGVALTYGGTKDDALRVEVGYTDSDNTVNTDFRNVVYNGNTVQRRNNFGGTVRIDYKLTGDWNNYRDFTAKETKETLFVVGAGADYAENSSNSILRTGADAQLELNNGLGMFTAVIVDFVDQPATLGNTTNYGTLVQVGYLLNPSWEIFGRGNVTFIDQAEYQYYPEITAGVNYFLGKNGEHLHRAKFTIDAGYLPNGSPATYTGLGVLQSTEGQYVIRAQFQLIL